MKIPLHLGMEFVQGKPTDQSLLAVISASRADAAARLELHHAMMRLNPDGWRKPKGAGSNRLNPRNPHADQPTYLQGLAIRAGVVAIDALTKIEGSERGNRKRIKRARHIAAIRARNREEDR